MFFLVNSYTTGLQPAVLRYMIATALKKYGGTVEADEIGLPVTASGLGAALWSQREIYREI